ncbi:MAG: phosphoesterase, partial [Paracoccus sp. (in: a-proteobacteria)]|nr:phosphoesterase [Paracoccus sp. (in: a-proteobacteria)]
MAHFFTADTHFSDDGTRRSFSRPFRDVMAMDAAMMAGLAPLGADDDLWIVGDFAACDTEDQRASARRVFDTISARKHLVRGNHDPEWVVRELPWQSVDDLVEVSLDGRTVVLCHYPLATWNNVRRGAIHLFGHVHDRWPGGEGQVNVGVDLWNFQPVTLDQAELAALTLPP